MRRISPAALPLRGEGVDSILHDEQPPALLGREFELVGGLAPRPAAQLLLRCPLQALAQQGTGGDAVRATVNLEAQRDDAIVLHPRAEIEAHALLRIACGSGDDVLARGEASDVARPCEMLDDERVVGFAHDFFSEVAGGEYERSRVTSRFTAAIAVSTCSAVVKRPRLKRSELCAS